MNGGSAPRCEHAEAAGLRLALQREVVRWKLSEAICLFVSGNSLVRCVLTAVGLKRC